MKQFVLGIATALPLAGVSLCPGPRLRPKTDPPPDRMHSRSSPGQESLDLLKLNDDPDQFHFAVVSDRTGGHRAQGLFPRVQQISLLQPTFVMSVGDLIEGYSLKEDVVKGSGMSSTATSRSSSAVLLRPRQPRPHQQVDGCHLGRAVRQALLPLRLQEHALPEPLLGESAGWHGHHRQGAADGSRRRLRN